MSKVMIIAPDREEIYYIKFLLDGFMSSNYVARESLNEVLSTEVDSLGDYDLVVVRFNMKGFSQYKDLIYSEESKIKTVIVFTDDQIEMVNEHITYDPLITSFNADKNDLVKLESSVKKLLKISQRLSSNPTYCKVRINYFLKFNKVICDVFLKLSEEKFIKIINRHQEYDNADIQKYVDKDCKHLYIKNTDFKMFTDGLVKSLRQESYNNLPVAVNDSSVIPLVCQETVHEMVHKMGLSTQALAITNEAINKTMGIIEKSDVFKLLKKTLGSGTYISEMSMLVNYISCAICKESEWRGSDNVLRLSIASFFQNIGLERDELAKIEELDGPEYLDLFSKDKKAVTDHPQVAVDTVNKIKGIPIGVDAILVKHHERYDGSGFPRGINYTRIEPLPAIFIISHELANILYETGFYRDIIIDAILDMEERYTKGSFAKIIVAMKKAFSIPLLEYDERELI